MPEALSIYPNKRLSSYDRESPMTYCAQVYNVAMEIFKQAERVSRPTSNIADAMAEELLACNS